MTYNMLEKLPLMRAVTFNHIATEQKSMERVRVTLILETAFLDTGSQHRRFFNGIIRVSEINQVILYLKALCTFPLQEWA